MHVATGLGDSVLFVLYKGHRGVSTGGVYCIGTSQNRGVDVQCTGTRNPLVYEG